MRTGTVSGLLSSAVRRRVWLAEALAFLALSPGAVVAQEVFTVRGTVLDETRAPVGGAEVLIPELARREVTNERGEFQFRDLPPGTHLMVTRMIGHLPARQEIFVGTPVTEVAIILRRLAYQLDSVDVTVSRRGLAGVVGDSALRPLAGASITIHGARHRAATDSTGRFEIPGLASGTYGVTVALEGYAPGRLVTTVPDSGRRELVILLAVEVPGSSRIPGASTAMHDLGRRLAWATPLSNLSGSELRRHAGQRLCEVPRLRLRFRDRPLHIIVNGTEVYRHQTLCDVAVDGLQLVEWGSNCNDFTGGVGMLLGRNCDGPRSAWDRRRGAYGVWVMIWTN